MDKIKVTEENLLLFKNKATHVKAPSGEYMYLPYWFKIEGDHVIPIAFDNLPEDLKETVLKKREEKIVYDAPRIITPEEAFTHRHIDDVIRMQKVMKENGIEISLSDCAGIWEEYSDMHAAGWLGLPEEDNSLFAILKNRMS